MTRQSWVCLACGRRYDNVRTFCGGCWAQGLIIDVGHRLPATVDREPEVTSARDVARMTWQTVESKRYAEVKLGRGAFVVATGAPGDGKSSLVTGLLDGIPAPVLLLSVEEPPGPTLAGRLLRIGVRRDDFGIMGRASVDQVVAMLRQTKAVALGIDSIQPSMFTARDVRHVLAVVPTLALVVATAQVNATGEIAGVRAVEHEADVVLDVQAMRWTIRKSRYQERGLTADVRLARVEGNEAA